MLGYRCRRSMANLQIAQMPSPQITLSLISISALPGLAHQPFPRERRQGVAKIADELRRVRFTWPEGFEDDQCRFWVGGLDGKAVTPFGPRQTKALIVSPFLSNPVVRDFLGGSQRLSEKLVHAKSALFTLRVRP